MKKRIIPMLVVIIMIINQVVSIATIDAFIVKSISLENAQEVEFIYNEVFIDTENSSISNMYLIQNTSGKDLDIQASIPLENLIIGSKINNLEIKVNNAKVKYEIEKTAEEVLYKFKIKAKANEAKKIEIKYNTENDLRNAKSIKYNLEGLKIGDKKIGKVKVDIKIREIDIPVVTKIYPPHYTFDLDTKTITVEYYNMPINNLTKDIIVNKIAYSSLTIDKEISDDAMENSYLYGELFYSENSQIVDGYTEVEFCNRLNNYIANNIEEIFNKNINGDDIVKNSKINVEYKIKYLNNNEIYDNKHYYFSENIDQYINEIKYKEGLIGRVCQYLEIRECIKNKEFEKINDLTSNASLLEYLIRNYSVKKTENDEENLSYYTKLKGITVCVDPIYREFYNEELESNSPQNNKMVAKAPKALDNVYCYEYEEGEFIDEEGETTYFKKIEKKASIYNMLSAGTSRSIDAGANIIYLDEITKENISNKERAEYVNSIGADLYIRYGYCDLLNDDNVVEFQYNSEAGKKIIEYIYENTEYSLDEYEWDEELQQSILVKRHSIDEYKTNEDTGLNYSKVPAIIINRGDIQYNEDKKIVYNQWFGSDIEVLFWDIKKDMFEIKEVKEMIDNNRMELEKEKANINTKIDDILNNITDDQEEIEIENENNGVDDKIIYLVISSCLIIGIIICISILIINNKKGGKNDEK